MKRFMHISRSAKGRRWSAVSRLCAICVAVVATTTATMGAGCDRSDADTQCLDPVKLKATLRAEIREELLAEMKSDKPTLDALRPPSVRKLLGGEKTAISTALAEKNAPKPMLTEPEIEHVPSPKSERPDKLTAEDRKALADDPAASPEKTPVLEWPTDDDGEKPPPSVKSRRAGHVGARRPAGQLDPKILPRPVRFPEGKTSAPSVPSGDESSRRDDEAAAREADKDDPARTVGIGGNEGGSDGGETGRTIRPGVMVMPSRDGLTVLDMAIAEKMRGKTPLRISESFATAPPRLACFGAYENRLKEVQITHVWRKGNKVLSRVELTVGIAAKWRTWSRQRTRGGNAEYSCEVLAPSGRRLGFARVHIGGDKASGTKP